MKISAKFCQRLLFYFICIHILCWTIVPTWVRGNLAMDSLEGVMWGQHLQFGYDRNPFLNGWLSAIAVTISNYQAWSIYLFSQLSVGIAFYAIWRLASKMFTAPYALIAVLLLEGVQYYNFHAIDFNDNNLELSLWATTIYFFYSAVTPNRKGHTFNWCMTGLFAGLAMMAKYYTAALLAAMTLFLLARADTRQQFFSKAPYFGLLIFLCVLTPHILWLFSHEFITVTYVFERANSIPSWTNHIFFAMQFAWDTFLAFVPAIFLLFILWFESPYILKRAPINVSQFNQQFLWYVGVGPFLLTLLLSMCMGINLRAGWGMPLLTLWSLLLISYLQPQLTLEKLKRFYIFILVLSGLLLTGYTVSLYFSSTTSSANFPGKELAKQITMLWRKHYNSKLEYVAGSRWIGSNIHFYSSDHPNVFVEWNQTRSPWINVDAMKRKGAVFYWEIDKGEKLSETVTKNYPHLIYPKPLTLYWQRNIAHLPPIHIGIAYLPPEQ